MLVPDHHKSLQKRKLHYSAWFQVWGKALLFNLIAILTGIVGLTLISVQQGQDWVGILGALLGILWLLLFILGYRKSQLMLAISGYDPATNQRLIKAWAKEKSFLISSDVPDYVVVTHPGLWWQSPSQFNFLFQGKKVWISTAKVNRWFSCAAPILTLITPWMGREARQGMAAKLAKLEWQKEQEAKHLYDHD